MQEIEGTNDGRGLRFAVVVSRYNDFVTDRLQEGAIEALRLAGAADDAITVIKAPGAFELTLAARQAADTHRFDAVVCLGCVIRGETPHFEYISSAVAHGITEAAAATGVPITFGVLTTNSAEQALARAGSRTSNKGWEAAMAAVQMATLLKRLRQTAGGGVRV